ncbi:MAG: NAD(P)-dependent oxidoreductase, partial [Actinobacteria bacterium]|nr:NAD(P)-dependent oxidoreductase [Actinomycetota bacterium]
MTAGLIASDQRLVTDVLVIGSGAGGATTAALIAEAGRDVLVVEEGPWVDQESVRPFSLDQMDRQYRSGGVTVALGLPSIAYTEGRCAGGGTEINSGLYFRPPSEVVERWRDDFRVADLDPGELDAIATEVERSLSVSTVPGRVTPASERLRDGADALGWKQNEIPRWMTYPPGGDATTGVRQSMTRTYLPRAFAAGARMVVGCRADRLVSLGSRALAAAVTYADGTIGTIRCRSVFVCGGAIQTPAILQRSGIRGLVGRSLAVHPTVKLAA